MGGVCQCHSKCVSLMLLLRLLRGLSVCGREGFPSDAPGFVGVENSSRYSPACTPDSSMACCIWDARTVRSTSDSPLSGPLLRWWRLILGNMPGIMANAGPANERTGRYSLLGAIETTIAVDISVFCGGASKIAS